MKKHEFETYDGKPASVMLRNTLRNDIAFRRLVAAYAIEDEPDHVQRFNFCKFVAYVVPGSVKGIDWESVNDEATELQFEQSYYGFAKLVEPETAFNCAQAVVDMQTRVDPIEKPDDALTEEESADPN